MCGITLISRRVMNHHNNIESKLGLVFIYYKYLLSNVNVGLHRTYIL